MPFIGKIRAHTSSTLSGDRWLRVEERRTADGGSVGVRIDITELKKREESFRLLFDSNPMPMWVIDLEDQKFLAVNDATVAHYGYSRDQFLAMTTFDMRSPEDRWEFAQYIQSGAESQDTRIWRHQKSDGSHIYVSIYARSMTYQGRKGRINAIVDVTSRKLAEDQLLAQKLQTDTAINNMSQGLLMFDRDARLVLCNKRYLEIYGISPDVVTAGCSLRELLDHRALGVLSIDPEEYCREVLSGIAQGKTTSRVIKLDDGRSIHAVNRPMAGGGWVSTHEDITERQRLLQAQNEAEKLLHEQKLQLDTALNNMSQGLLMFDASERIVVVNKRYLDMYGLSPGVVKPGCTFRELILHRKEVGNFAGDVETYCSAVISDITQGKISQHLEETVDGRSIKIVNNPMAGGGWVATLEDITPQLNAERERERDREFLHQIIDNVPVMIAVKDATERRFMLINRAAEAVWGVSRTDALGKTAHELFPLAQADMIDKQDDEVMRSSTPLVLDAHPNMARSGDSRIVTSKRLAIRGNDGKPQYLVSVVEDVTEYKHVEEERDRNREFLNLIIDNIPTMIVVRDVRDRRYVLINRAAESFFGASRDRIIGQTVQDICPKDIADMIDEQDRRQLQSDGRLSFSEYQINTIGMGARIHTLSKVTIFDSMQQPQYLVSVIDDVTECRQMDEHIAHLAHHDPLTDLPNRALFRSQLEQSLKWARHGEQVAVLYLDLDNFKEVNDTLGHPAGDELLKVVAMRLSACLRENETVARLGGDEFAIILNAVRHPSKIIDLVKDIHESVSEPIELDSHQIISDVSIGISMAPSDDTDPDRLLKNADLALYVAKSEGRGTHRFFEPTMDARMKAKRELENELRQAIRSDGFDLYFQPLVNLADGKISSCEALLRWRHPKRGMVSPAEFIPVAEETGLIAPLGEWVLKTACAEAALWQDNIKVAVNVSPVQFKSKTFPLTVVSALAASGLPAHRLVLEITEAVLIRDDEEALAMLKQLRGLGVQVAMDDFGTGYSSLSYLQRFPFDKIKIDRCFIKDLGAKDCSPAIVQAVIDIARSRNIATTAEGVETPQQMDLLRTLGCTEAQGYLFSPPMPAAELSGLFRSYRDKTVDAA